MQQNAKAGRCHENDAVLPKLHQSLLSRFADPVATSYLSYKAKSSLVFAHPAGTPIPNFINVCSLIFSTFQETWRL
jgi:hypothetical protein